MKKLISIMILSIALIYSSGRAQTVAAPGEPFAFIYEKVTNEKTGEEIVVRKAYPYSVKQQKDEDGISEKLNTLQKRGTTQQNTDFRSLAAWLYFYDQLQMWQEYIGKTIFRRSLGSETPTQATLNTMVQQGEAGEAGVMATSQTPADTPITLTKASFKTIKDIKWKDQAEVEKSLQEVFESMQTLALQISDEQKQEVVKITNNIEERADKRVAYKGWLDEIKSELEKFSADWQDEKQGKVVNLDGYKFLISNKPLTALPREHFNVVSPTGFLTPYDFLNEDGSFKKPAE